MENKSLTIFIGIIVLNFLFDSFFEKKSQYLSGTCGQQIMGFFFFYIIARVPITRQEYLIGNIH